MLKDLLQSIDSIYIARGIPTDYEYIWWKYFRKIFAMV